jgi:acid stress chaperone HdeB
MLKRAPIFAGLLLSAISPLNAQVSIDVAKITCQQFATSNPDRIALWLNGYFHGKRGDMIVETQCSGGDTRKVQDYCVKNPDVLLMQAVETISKR